MLSIFALLFLIVAIVIAAIAVCIWAAVLGFKLIFWVAPVLLVFVISLIVFVVGGLS